MSYYRIRIILNRAQFRTNRKVIKTLPDFQMLNSQLSHQTCRFYRRKQRIIYILNRSICIKSVKLLVMALARKIYQTEIQEKWFTRHGWQRPTEYLRLCSDISPCYRNKICRIYSKGLWSCVVQYKERKLIQTMFDTHFRIDCFIQIFEFWCEENYWPSYSERRIFCISENLLIPIMYQLKIT